MILKLIKNEFFLERKSSFNLLYITFFAISCFMFLLFSFPVSKIFDTTVFTGFFWIIISLSTIKLVENSFAREKDYNIYDIIYSTPIDLTGIYLAKLLCLNLILLGIQLIIFLSYIILSNLIKKYHANGGIILTASHNPGGEEGDFGIKLNGSNGSPVSEKENSDIFKQAKKISAYKETN